MKNSYSDQFSIKLDYENGTDQGFNGNITKQYWDWSNNLNPAANTFNYGYDPLNRLVSAAKTTGTAMSESLTYDVMGNIKSLNRDNLGAKAYTDFNFNASNRLQSVSGLTVSDYEYDANGNATIDGNKGIQLTYNYLNLPKTAIKGTAVNLAYTYDAEGNKLSKNDNGTIRNYIGGIEYNPDATIDLIHTEEGVAQNNGGTYTYHYNLSDHLGNVRYTFDIYNGAVRMLQRDDYYAFGLRKSISNTSGAISLQNKYLYNGKELQDGLEQYDYGARFYDPVIGRWNSVDPAAEYYPEITPYSYVVNDPISLIDDDGEMPGPTGFVLGALSDYIGQVGNNYFFKGKNTLSAAMTEDINYWSIGISGAVGAATGGIDAIKNIATKGVGKEIFKKMIEYGVDVLVNTMQGVLSEKLDQGNFDFWKSLTGGLIQALPIKYVDKLQKKLQKNMAKQARKMVQATNRLARPGLSQASRQTASRNLLNATHQYSNYRDAYIGVKTVYDSFISGGVSALTDKLFMKPKPTSTITVGEISAPEVIK